MDLSRRRLFRYAGAAAVPLLPGAVAAQNYPTRPVHLVVTVPAGGSPDIVARLLGQWLSDRLAQPFVVENRPGASANIGTEFVVRAAPDGYTLLIAMSANAINASLYPNLNYNFMRDTAPVALIGGIPLVLVANPSFPARTVPELIAYAKANPGKIDMATAGKGTPLDVAGELFKMMAGVDMVGVSYQGESPAIPDLPRRIKTQWPRGDVTNLAHAQMSTGRFGLRSQARRDRPPHNQDYDRAHDRADQTGAFASFVPPDRLAKVCRNEGSDNSEQRRQNKAGRLIVSTRMK